MGVQRVPTFRGQRRKQDICWHDAPPLSGYRTVAWARLPGSVVGVSRTMCLADSSGRKIAVGGPAVSVHVRGDTKAGVSGTTGPMPADRHHTAPHFSPR